jgi:hypothetical protein
MIRLSIADYALVALIRESFWKKISRNQTFVTATLDVIVELAMNTLDRSEIQVSAAT